MLKAVQILLESTSTIKQAHIRSNDIKKNDESSSMFAEKLQSTLEKTKVSKTTKSRGQADRTPKSEDSPVAETVEDGFLQEDKESIKKTGYEYSLANPHLFIQFSEERDLEFDNTGIIQGILLENDINSLSSDIETETLSKVAVHGEVIQLLNDEQDDKDGVNFQDFGMETLESVLSKNLDTTINQRDSKYLNIYSEHSDDAKITINDESKLNVSVQSDMKKQIVPEIKGVPEILIKAREGQDIQLRATQAHNSMNYIQGQDMKVLLEEETSTVIGLREHEVIETVEDTSINQDEINQETNKDDFKNNIQLQQNSLGAVEISFQDTSIDFSNALYRRDFIEGSKIIEQIADKVVMTVGEGNTELEIQVKPEHLGKLILKVGLEDGILTGKIYTSSQQVKEFLQDNLDTLRNTLREQGLIFASLDVDVGSQSSLNYFHNFNFTSSKPGPRKSSLFTNVSTVEKSETKSTLSESLSQIDYLA
jgi:hypothetical protein